MNDLDRCEESDGDAIELGQEHCVVATGHEALGPLSSRRLIGEVCGANDGVGVGWPESPDDKRWWRRNIHIFPSRAVGAVVGAARPSEPDDVPGCGVGGPRASLLVGSCGVPFSPGPTRTRFGVPPGRSGRIRRRAVTALGPDPHESARRRRLASRPRMCKLVHNHESERACAFMIVQVRSQP